MNPLQQAAHDHIGDDWRYMAEVLWRLATCPTCNGDGRNRGTGYVTSVYPDCPDCDGTGHTQWVEMDFDGQTVPPALIIPLTWLEETP